MYFCIILPLSEFLEKKKRSDDFEQMYCFNVRDYLRNRSLSKFIAGHEFSYKWAAVQFFIPSALIKVD